MSHYAVLVIHNDGQNIDELLAPYSENLKVEPYLKYKYDEAIKKAKEEYGYRHRSNKELFKIFANDYGLIDINGNLYSTYNPKSKWDWYSIGGRFSGELELTEEGRLNAVGEIEKKYHIDIDLKNLYEDSDYLRYVDTAPLKYIKWFTPLSEKDKGELKRWWEINVDGDELKDGEEKDDYFFWNPEWFKRRYKDVDTYLKVKEMVALFAVLTPDGEWHEPGRMGYFACALCEPEDELEWDFEFYDRFIKPNLDSDLICTIVDCHI